MSKIKWTDYFMRIKDTVALRATCDRGRSGCVITKNNHILTTGYVGSPPGMPECDEVGHELVNGHCIRTIHAEQNAICQAAKFGIAIDGATLYCTMTPCRTCAMLIISSGIKHVVCEKHYKDEQQDRDCYVLLLNGGVTVEYTTQDKCEY